MWIYLYSVTQGDPSERVSKKFTAGIYTQLGASLGVFLGIQVIYWRLFDIEKYNWKLVRRQELSNKYQRHLRNQRELGEMTKMPLGGIKGLEVKGGQIGHLAYKG